MPEHQRPIERRAHVDNVHLEPRCQCREEIDQEYVATLVEAFQAEREIPRIEVWEVTADENEPRLVVVDGYHRRQALKILKREWLHVEIVGTGSLDEASWYAIGRNHEHGLRRTFEDRKKAIRYAFENPLARDYANTTIAKQTGCNAKLVAEIRDEVESAIEMKTGAEPSRTRTGVDGKRYPARKKKAQPERDERVPDDEPIDTLIGAIKEDRLHAQKMARQHEWGRVLFTQLAEKLGVCEAFLETSRPTLCPACRGEKCPRCSQRGWMTQERAKLIRQEGRG